MSDMKAPRFLFLVVILALAGAMLVAGCGGSGGTTATDQGPPPGSNAPEATEEAEAEQEPAEATEEEPAEKSEEAEAEEKAPAEEEEAAGGEEEGGASAAMVAEGKTVFTTNCGTCHTLAEAGTSGVVGPNLDELEPSDSTVEHQVINGGGPMPAFGKEEILTSTEVEAVAAYVSSVAGSE